MATKKTTQDHADVKTITNPWQVLFELVTHPKVFIPTLVVAGLLAAFFSMNIKVDSKGFSFGKRAQIPMLYGKPGMMTNGETRFSSQVIQSEIQGVPK